MSGETFRLGRAEPSWRPTHTKHRIVTAIRNGTPDLDLRHRITLLVFANELRDEYLRQFDARVRLGAEEIAYLIGAPVSRIRWHVQNLCSNCASGPYMEDHTATTPGAPEVYDLGPVLTKLRDMEALARADSWPIFRRRRFR